MQLFTVVITHRAGTRQLEKLVLAGSAEEAREMEAGTIAMFAPKFAITSIEPVPAAELRQMITRLEAERARRQQTLRRS